MLPWINGGGIVNLLDRIIGYIAPETGLRRVQARASIQNMQAFFGTNKGPYSAANKTRLNMAGGTLYKENDVDPNRLQSLRVDAWNLYRDNPSARKLVRSITSKVIGRGMVPESLATDASGNAAVEFRARAKKLWFEMQTGFDSRGLPGRGGQTLSGLQRLALRNCIITGESLAQIKPITASERAARGLPVPVVLQLIDGMRLAEETDIEKEKIQTGNHLFRGIEFDANWNRVRYWLKDGQSSNAAIKPVEAKYITHLFIEDDIDQFRGVSWFAAAMMQMKDTSDLQYNVLKASAMAACVVGSYSKPTGATRWGLNASETSAGTADGTDLTDADGNAITKIQPGMFVNTGKDGSFELHSPNQPNMNPEAFIQHLQRGTGTCFPGVKASTITGDYRNSSFSSERSADNDTWPEIHELQEWFSASFCQPIYESVVRAGVLSGYFDGIVSASEFQSDPGRYCSASWHGPVALSINPKDDAEAAVARIHGGLSSLQMECAKVNVNWRDVMNDAAELQTVAAEKGLPDEFVNNLIGIDTSDHIVEEPAASGGDAQDATDTQPRSLSDEYKREFHLS